MADNVHLTARLVSLDGEKLLEVKESKSDDFVCPDCKHLITQRNGKEFPNFLLEPKNFHETHRPIDFD